LTSEVYAPKYIPALPVMFTNIADHDILRGIRDTTFESCTHFLPQEITEAAVTNVKIVDKF